MDNASIPNNAGGSKTGKDSTGNSAPFPFAFDMMAAIAVIADAMQMLSKETMIQYKSILPISRDGKKKRKSPAPRMDNDMDKVIVNSNFPKNTSMGRELSLSKREVPRSSSITNVLDNPVMLPKNKTIHNNAEAIYFSILSPAVVNAIVEMVMTMNKNNADNAILDLNSIAISFRKTAMLLYNVFILILRDYCNDHSHDLWKMMRLPFVK